MKKGVCMFFVLLGILLLPACGKVQIEPNIPLQELLVEYDSDQINAFAAAANGTVYIFTVDWQARSEFSSENVINQYNAQGTLMDTYDLSSYSWIQAAATDEAGEMVYFIGQGHGNFISLYALDTATGRIGQLYDFPYFKTAKALVLLQDRLYILGQQKYVYLYSNIAGQYDFSAEERLVYYSLDSGEVYELGLEYPINIAPGEDGILNILGYFPSEGYCMMEYDPKSDQLAITEDLEAYKFDYFAVCNQGKSLIYGYNTNPYGLLLADYGNMDLEVELYQRGGFSDLVSYAGGMVYCIDEELKHLVSFPLDAVQRRNPELRIISTFSPMAPYACGYTFQRSDLRWDEIVLKVLAQDRNYDICTGISSYSGSLVMQESNAFYPLDDVPGIQEYLERCFPYIREAATNKEGAIWMFPYAIGIRGIVVQEKFAEQAGLSFHDNMSFTELADMVCGLPEEEKRKVHLYPDIFAEHYVLQYFSHNITAENASFAECMKSILRMYQSVPFTYTLPKDFFCRDAQIGLYAFLDSDLLQYDTIYGFPKENSTDKNVATCYFLAINPNSSHLQEALTYIADLIPYLMNQENIWFFQDLRTEEGSIQSQIHGLYENAEICFGIDEEVYVTDIDKVLSGELSIGEFAKEASRKFKIYLGE